MSGYAESGARRPVYLRCGPVEAVRKNRTAANLDHYAKRSVYIIALPMAEFAQSRFRVTYRLVEEVDRVEEIKHNVVRMTLLDMKYDSPLNIAIISDLPGGTGLGSSSSFAAGFIFLMERLGGHAIAKLDLFKRAVYTEQVLLNENVGIPESVALACLLACLYRRSTTRLCNRAGATDENQREKERQRPFALFKLCHAGLELLEGNEPGNRCCENSAAWLARGGNQSGGNRRYWRPSLPQSRRNLR